MLFTAPLMAVKYLEKPISDYCDDITIGMPVKAVSRLADDSGFYIFQRELPSNGTIVIDTKKSPMFRLACFVDVEDGVVVSKYIQSSD